MAITNATIIFVAFVLQITLGAYIMHEKHIVNKGAKPSILQEDERLAECQVTKKYKIPNWSGEPIVFWAYIEDDGAVACTLHYHNTNIHLVYDKLILSQKRNTIHEFRHEDIEETKFETFLDAAGWTPIEISMRNHQICMKYWNLTTLNYTVSLRIKDMVIHGSNITICEKKSPTYQIYEGSSAIIPLEPSRKPVDPFNTRTFGLNLLSKGDFTPCIIVGEHKKCLTRGNGSITFTNTTQTTPLLAGSLNLYLEIVTGSINIYQMIEGKEVDKTSFPRQGMKFIEVIGIQTNFSVSLDLSIKPMPSINDNGSVVTGATLKDTLNNGNSVESFISTTTFGAVMAILMLIIAILIGALIYITKFANKVSKNFGCATSQKGGLGQSIDQISVTTSQSSDFQGLKLSEEESLTSKNDDEVGDEVDLP